MVKVKILLLMSGLRHSNARLDIEIREIKEIIRKSTHRIDIEVITEIAVRYNEIQTYLVRHNPDLVHITAHGTDNGELMLEDNNGEIIPISHENIVSIFKNFKRKVKTVVLNLCYSFKLASELAREIDYVIGIAHAIPHKCAEKFAIGFFESIGEGFDIKKSFELGKTKCQVDLPFHTLLVDFHRETIDPSQISFVDGSQTIFQLSQAEQFKILIQTATSEILTNEYVNFLKQIDILIKEYRINHSMSILNSLKDRIWDTCSNIVKFKISIQIGKCHYLLTNFNEAARIFIEAFPYSEQDHDAYYYSALGYYLLENYSTCNDLVMKAIDINPVSELAYSLLIKIAPEEKSFDQVISEIPINIIENSSIAFSLSILANKRNLADVQFNWLEKAVINDLSENPDFRGGLGVSLYEEIQKDYLSVKMGQLTEEQKERLHRVIDLLNFAWNKVKFTDLQIYRIYWLNTRGLAKRLIDDLQGALQDLNFALIVNPDDLSIMTNKALILMDFTQYDEAIEILYNILSKDLFPNETILNLVEVIIKKGEKNRAVDIIKNFIEENPTFPLIHELYQSLIELYLILHEKEKAREISSILKNTFTLKVFDLINEARILFAFNEKENANNQLKEASSLITDESTFEEVLILAQAYYQHKFYPEALELYERITNPELNSNLTEILVRLYYFTDNLEKTLEICQNLRVKFGILEIFTDLESYIYDITGDLPKAIDLTNQLLVKYPHNYNFRIVLCELYLRDNNVGLVRDLVDIDIKLEDLTKDLTFRIIKILFHIDEDHRAFDLLYEARRKYFDDQETHFQYFATYLSYNIENADWYNVPDQVSIDSAVGLKNNNRIEFYVIVNRSDVNFQFREISSEDSLALRLLGKSIDEEIIIREGLLTTETGKIVFIYNKYSFAWIETKELFFTRFTDQKFIDRFDILDPDSQDILPEGEEIINNVLQRQNSLYNDVENLYLSNKITMGTAANLLHRNSITLWHVLTGSSKLGIFCFSGNMEEWNYILSILRDTAPKIILDITSILILRKLSGTPKIIEKFGKFGITQSTIDLVNEEQSKTELDLRAGIKYFDQNFIMHETPQEIVENYKLDLESIQDWIDQNCDLIPIDLKFFRERDKKKHLEDLMGKSYIDSILIASEPNQIFCSEDEQLRTLARKHFKVYGCWTQIILAFCYDINLLEVEEYLNDIYILSKLNHFPLVVNPEIIYSVIEESDFLPINPLTNLLSHCHYNTQFVIDVLGTIWGNPIFQNRKEFISNDILYYYSIYRDKNPIHELFLLENHLKNKLLVYRKFNLSHNSWNDVYLFIQNYNTKLKSQIRNIQ